jgi:O-antigen/teichoic acid export membrane protein
LTENSNDRAHVNLKSAFRNLQANPRHVKLFHWGKLITITGGAQAIVQGLGLICGLLVIWLLPTKEYAWYTIVNTMLGTMIILADGGVAIGVMSEGAKVWEDKNKLGSVLATGLDLRKKFAFGSLLVSLPIIFYLLIHHGAGWMTTLLISISLIPVFYASLSDSLLEIIPKLHQDISSLQKNQVAVSIGRLLLSGLTLFIFPFAYIAVLASGIPRIYGNMRLYEMAGTFANRNQPSNTEIRNKILRVVKRIMPEAIYYCLSGQITIWLISIFGSTTSVAEVGALGRLAMILNVFTVVLSTVIIPRFAKLTNNKIILVRRLLQIIAGMILICSFIIGIAWLFPNQLLWILGKNYKNLNANLLFLSIYGSCLGLLVGTVFGLYTSRGWSINPILSITISIISTIISIFIFDITSIKGVLLINIFLGFVQFITHGSYFFLKISKINSGEKTDIKIP